MTKRLLTRIEKLEKIAAYRQEEARKVEIWAREEMEAAEAKAAKALAELVKHLDKIDAMRKRIPAADELEATFSPEFVLTMRTERNRLDGKDNAHGKETD